MRRLNVVLACSAVAWMPGCSSHGETPSGVETSEDVGGIQVALSNVPSSVRCVRIAAMGSRSQTRLFSAESGSSASYSLTALPSGIVKVDGAAFSEACADVTSSTAPRYVAEAPVSVRVDPYEVGSVTLRMLVNGAISIGIDFERDRWASEARNPLDLAFVTDLPSTFLYVATERDNDVSATSRLSVLRFDTSAATATLTASNEWNLTSDLPSVGANLGLEAITFVPDAYLTSKGFLDETTGMPYDPSRYPNHAGGVFLVGVEANGLIYAYVLDHGSGGFTRIANIVSGQTGVMDLQFDRDVGYLWSACDDTCQGQLNILDIDTTTGSSTLGRFKVQKSLARPSTMPNINNEGIAFFTEAECSSGRRSFFWTDDAQTSGNALRQDSIPCGRF